jgi:hypothetical protein
MKFYLSKPPASPAASPAGHKAIQHHGNKAKTVAHRYERRRVRALLRQGGGLEFSFYA